MVCAIVLCCVVVWCGGVVCGVVMGWGVVGGDRRLEDDDERVCVNGSSTRECGVTVDGWRV